MARRACFNGRRTRNSSAQARWCFAPTSPTRTGNAWRQSIAVLAAPSRTPSAPLTVQPSSASRASAHSKRLCGALRYEPGPRRPPWTGPPRCGPNWALSRSRPRTPLTTCSSTPTLRRASRATRPRACAAQTTSAGTTRPRPDATSTLSRTRMGPPSLARRRAQPLSSAARATRPCVLHWALRRNTRTPSSFSGEARHAHARTPRRRSLRRRRSTTWLCDSPPLPTRSSTSAVSSLTTATPSTSPSPPTPAVSFRHFRRDRQRRQVARRRASGARSSGYVRCSRFRSSSSSATARVPTTNPSDRSPRRQMRRRRTPTLPRATARLRKPPPLTTTRPPVARSPS
mmetsp:Transcript_47817/g.147491  ORF Transcript_47817/g.147491 Transcript_47817/m.147491 type:complete len:343 (+) Transcript_47817:1887-2915(+)